jgi:tight adherence protein B
MSELILGAGAAAAGGAAIYAWRVQRLRRVARERLHSDVARRADDAEIELQPTLRRRRWLPWAAGAVAGGALYALTPLPWIYCLAVSAIAGTIAFLVELQIAVRAALRLETQLANAIDLMVAALAGGAGVTEALDSAARESKEPLRSEVEELLGRVRYGEAPQRVFEDFAERVPLEAYRLFCFTMAVHAEVGGSLAPTLSTVGRTIRDRIEISRRVRAQSTEAQASVVGIVCITYFLALLMWRANPVTFEAFLRTPVGSSAAAGAIVLQAVGLVWITKLAQMRF